jgi:hydroxymethylpyrimidine pyrophosphatase-like HAD family hydrolase
VNDSAVVLDLDGTLLNSEKQVSGRSLRAILRLRGDGCFGLCRSYRFLLAV